MGGWGVVIRMEEEEEKKGKKKKANAKNDQATWTIPINNKDLLFGSQNSDEVCPITPTLLLRLVM